MEKYERNDLHSMFIKIKELLAAKLPYSILIGDIYESNEKIFFTAALNESGTADFESDSIKVLRVVFDYKTVYLRLIINKSELL